MPFRRIPVSGVTSRLLTDYSLAVGATYTPSDTGLLTAQNYASGYAPQLMKLEISYSATWYVCGADKNEWSFLTDGSHARIKNNGSYTCMLQLFKRVPCSVSYASPTITSTPLQIGEKGFLTLCRKGNVKLCIDNVSAKLIGGNTDLEGSLLLSDGSSLYLVTVGSEAYPYLYALD